MSYRISILDKSPLAAGETAAQALARTLTLAQQAEAWGYHRFWIAEHHNTEQLASPSPELAIAWILGQTRRIRVGSGGVMLQHYSPYKVAENFNLLAALAPGRVDLGVAQTAFSSAPAWKARSWRRSWTGTLSSPLISTVISICCARCSPAGAN